MEQNKRMRILMCQNSTEGILCGVYEAFTSRYGHAWQKLAVGPYVNGDLFSDIYSVEVNTEKAGKVVKAIISKIRRRHGIWYTWRRRRTVRRRERLSTDFLFWPLPMAGRF